MTLNKDNYSHAWIYSSTKEAVAEHGISAAVILCFKTEPETRLTLWFAKDTSGKWCFMTPTFRVFPAQGEKQIPCLFGQLADEMTAVAESAKASCKELLTKQGKEIEYGRVYKVMADKVEIAA